MFILKNLQEFHEFNSFINVGITHESLTRELAVNQS